MNRIAYTAFTAFWSSMATLFAVYALAGDPLSVGQGDGELREISRQELARHDHEDSCWKAINGKVYDVTDYIPEHPTRPSVILDWCGKESTTAWNTKGHGRPHSEKAEAMLEQYRVGRLPEAE